MQHSWRLRPINCGLQLSAAVALCFIPSNGTSNVPHAGHYPLCLVQQCMARHLIYWGRKLSEPLFHHAVGWLFLGSHTGDSQILAAPRRLADELAAGTPISDAALQWQVRSMIILEVLSKQCPFACTAEACFPTSMK
jgi:hypothetical protein